MSYPSPPHNIQQLTNYLAAFDLQIREISIRRSTAEFNRLIGEPYEDLEKLNQQTAQIMLNPVFQSVIEEWHKKVEDPRLKRQLDIISRAILSARIDNNSELFKISNPIENRILAFQPEINGKKYSRSDWSVIMETNPDRSFREAAFRANKVLDKAIQDDVLALFDKRNELARQLGYDDYVQFGLYLQDLDETELRRLFEQIKDTTQAKWNGILNDITTVLKIDKVHPWDVTYYTKSMIKSVDSSRFPKSGILDSIRRMLHSIGGDIDKLPIKVIEKDIPYGGLCVPIELGKDIRILANPRDGLHWYDALFHEIGHAIHGSRIDTSSYMVPSGDPSFFWEGIAGLFGRIVYEPAFLKTEFHLTPDEIDRVIRSSRINRISWFRNIPVVCLLEWAVYRGEPDPDSLQQSLLKEYRGYESPECLGWAGNTLYTTHPLYHQNYIMMDVMAMHTVEAIRKRFSRFPYPEMFDFIVSNYIAPGGWVPWRQKIENATGKPLSAEALGKDLSAP